ncbi:MAG: DUF5665 domain-containing protein [Patescibacteria group bacterium]|nr:DUF5665 domain-containing protein [Patescibacteria group bacterium]
MTEIPEEKIDKLLKYQEKQVSLKFNFYRGIVYGFGFFIGSAVLVGFLFYILSLVDTVPILGDFTVRIVEFVQEHQALR